MLRKSGVAVGLILELLDWKPDFVYQVGIGLHHQEVDVMKETWPDCKFVGFEPHPDIVKSLGDYPGKVHQIALSDYVGKTTLHSKRAHKDGSSLHKHKEPGNYQEIEVGVATLDSFNELWKKNYNNLLWIDCEGSELAVLKGGEIFIEQFQVINIEMTSDPPGEWWCDPVDVHCWLVEHGFYTQWLHTQRSSAGQCDAIYVRKELFSPRCCCVPSEVKRWGNEIGKIIEDDLEQSKRRLGDLLHFVLQLP